MKKINTLQGSVLAPDSSVGSKKQIKHQQKIQKVKYGNEIKNSVKYNTEKQCTFNNKTNHINYVPRF